MTDSLLVVLRTHKQTYHSLYKIVAYVDVNEAADGTFHPFWPET